MSHQWTLHKDGQTFIFRCRAGGEGRLLAEIADQAANGRIALDQADLAVLVRMITEVIPTGWSTFQTMLSLHEQATSAGVRSR